MFDHDARRMPVENSPSSRHQAGGAIDATVVRRKAAGVRLAISSVKSVHLPDFRHRGLMREINRILCPWTCPRYHATPSTMRCSWRAGTTRRSPCSMSCNPVVIPSADFAVVQMPPNPEDIAETRARVAECLASAGASDAAVIVEGGEPVDRILEHARTLPADLLVIGTHGAGGFEHLVLGSTTEKVLRKATCPGADRAAAGAGHVEAAVQAHSLPGRLFGFLAGGSRLRVLAGAGRRRRADHPPRLRVAGGRRPADEPADQRPRISSRARSRPDDQASRARARRCPDVVPARHADCARQGLSRDSGDRD